MKRFFTGVVLGVLFLSAFQARAEKNEYSFKILEIRNSLTKDYVAINVTDGQMRTDTSVARADLEAIAKHEGRRSVGHLIGFRFDSYEMGAAQAIGEYAEYCKSGGKNLIKQKVADALSQLKTPDLSEYIGSRVRDALLPDFREHTISEEWFAELQTKVSQLSAGKIKLIKDANPSREVQGPAAYLMLVTGTRTIPVMVGPYRNPVELRVSREKKSAAKHLYTIEEVNDTFQLGGRVNIAIADDNMSAHTSVPRLELETIAKHNGLDSIQELTGLEFESLSSSASGAIKEYALRIAAFDTATEPSKNISTRQTALEKLPKEKALHKVGLQEKVFRYFANSVVGAMTGGMAGAATGSVIIDNPSIGGAVGAGVGICAQMIKSHYEIKRGRNISLNPIDHMLKGTGPK